MTGTFSRSKGKRGELEIVHMLRDNLGLTVNRQLKQYQQAQHGDIEQLVGPYLIEVKNCATLSLKSWWAQTIAAADKKGAIPCLAYKVARKGWLFVVPLAWGQEWGRDLAYTQTLYPDGFFYLVREHGPSTGNGQA